MADGELKLLQGTLDFLILEALAGESQHGYGVARWIRETTDGALEVEEGALYTALHRMERRKWLTSEWGVSETGRRAKFYEITPAGREALADQAGDWKRYVEAVFKILRSREAST